MDPSEFHFYTRMFSELSGALNAYINGTASTIIAAIRPVAKTLMALYVVLWAWSMIRGLISEPILDGLGRIVRLAIIGGVALQIGYYNEVLSNMLWESPDALADLISGGSGATNSNYLDTLMSQMYNLGGAYYHKSQANSSALGIPDLGLLSMAFAFWLSGIVATGYAAFLLALSKIALAVLLGVGPIFVLLTIFESTKRFFDAWLGQALNYVFLVMLSAATVKLMMAILKQYLTDASGQILADPGLDQAIPAIAFSLVTALILVQLPSIASALGGGVAVGTLGAVAWAYGSAKAGAVAMRPTNLRRALLRAQSDVRILKAADKAVGTVPIALYRKITGGSKNRVMRG